MRRTRALSTIGTLALVAGASHAGVIEIDSFHTGGFYGLDGMGMPTATPDNDMSFQNYFMGHSTVSGFTTPERRSFFAFDLSGAIPDGEEIVSMSLVLENVFGGTIANMTGGMEVVEFTSTSFGYDEIADPDAAMIPAIDIFDSFGMGAFYGDAVFDMDGPLPGPVEIVLSPDAIADAFDAMMLDETFMISGALATYDPEPDAMFEFVFGLTDVVVDSTPTGFPVPKLVITTAPIPTPSGVLVFAGMGLLAGRRNR
jgi:hypothetical protein